MDYLIGRGVRASGGTGLRVATAGLRSFGAASSLPPAFTTIFPPSGRWNSTEGLGAPAATAPRKARVTWNCLKG
jgi:hypothetical protein